MNKVLTVKFGMKSGASVIVPDIVEYNDFREFANKFPYTTDVLVFDDHVIIPREVAYMENVPKEELKS
ncbi:hypothetical protein TAFFO16_248 [Bacillus phage Taffo16]|uniref:Uncharacterized protein n=1 Tax=Bacillus phage Taffo16 TaxID=2030094 RepID=A0A249XVH7_9CAUD|nr:hypothetical protein TAFFO16_248 [Bacillus phage Taffo16]